MMIPALAHGWSAGVALAIPGVADPASDVTRAVTVRLADEVEAVSHHLAARPEWRHRAAAVAGLAVREDQAARLVVGARPDPDPERDGQQRGDDHGDDPAADRHELGPLGVQQAAEAG